MTVDEMLAGGVVRPVVEVTSWLDGEPLGVVPISQGTVVESASGDALARLQITVPASPEWLPTHPGHPLAAFGQELIVRRGFLTPAGEPVGWEHLGKFRVSPSPAPSGGWLEVEAVSIDSRLSSARWVVATETGDSFTEQIYGICAGVVDVWFDDALVNGWAQPRSWEQQGSRRESLLEVCDVWGAVPRIIDGRLMIVPAPSSSTPTATIRSGPGGTLIGVEPVTDSALAPNAVVAISQPPESAAPTSAMVALSTGPRRWTGPYGMIPEFMTSPLLLWWADCRRAAETRLMRLQAAAPDVEVQVVTDPRIRLDSVVRVIDEVGGSDFVMRVTDATHALTAGAEPGRLRGALLSGRVAGVDW